MPALDHKKVAMWNTSAHAPMFVGSLGHMPFLVVSSSAPGTSSGVKSFRGGGDIGVEGVFVWLTE